MCSHTDVLVAVLKWSQYCAALVAALKCSYSDHLLLCRFGSRADVLTQRSQICRDVLVAVLKWSQCRVVLVAVLKWSQMVALSLLESLTSG